MYAECGALEGVLYLLIVVGKPFEQALFLLHFKVGARFLVSESLLALFLCFGQVENLCLTCVDGRGSIRGWHLV